MAVVFNTFTFRTLCLFIFWESLKIPSSLLIQESSRFPILAAEKGGRIHMAKSKEKGSSTENMVFVGKKPTK
ncbi:MAG: hypothetical protein QW328_08385 [Nitrososphaerota archaeon]